MDYFNKNKKKNIKNSGAALIPAKEHNFHTLILDLDQIETDKAFKKSINSFRSLRWRSEAAENRAIEHKGNQR